MSKKSDIEKTKAYIKFLECFIEDDLQPEDRNELLQDLEHHKSRLRSLRKLSKAFSHLTAGGNSPKSSESESEPAKASEAQRKKDPR